MHPIIYDVAISADGFICGADGDVSAFAHDGPVVDAYRARLATYATALMGRRTYEFGYEFGLEPGANPYPHMRCIVVSRHLALPGDQVTILPDMSPARLGDLRTRSAGPVYLCGGGALAGDLLRRGAIDILRLKRAPILLGRGVRLFGGHDGPVPLRLEREQSYPGGYLYQEFRIT